MSKCLPISVIVPTYNRASYLPETIKAILSQGSQDMELIIVDDNSSDHSRNILTSFKEKYPKIVLVFLEENLGESNAVNVGWSLATQQFISIVNSDDPPHKNWLLSMSKEIQENPGFGFYYPNRLVIDENGYILRKELLKDWSKKTLFEKLVPIASAGLIVDRESLPKDFKPRDASVIYPSDLIQMFRLGLLTDGFRVKSAWGTWRQHRESISGSQSSMLLARQFELSVGKWLQINEEHIEQYSRRNIRNFFFHAHVLVFKCSGQDLFQKLVLFLKSTLFREILKNPMLFLIGLTFSIKRLLRKCKFKSEMLSIP